jgi:cytochrome c-type biogenesis protein CcmE
VSRRARVVTAAVVAAAAMTMVLLGTWQASVPFVGPGDLGSEFDGQRVQVEGRVDEFVAQHDRLVLELSSGDGARVIVHYPYADQRPLTLETGRIVVAKGLYAEGVVDAHQVSVRAHEE